MSMKRRDRSRSGSSDRHSYDRTSRSRNERNLNSSSLNKGSRKVYVSNVTFDCTFQELKDEFNTIGEVTFVQMLKDDDKRFKGCALITFKEPNMAHEAIETMNRHEFKGRKLVVKEEDAMNEPRTRERDRKRPTKESNIPSRVTGSGIASPMTRAAQNYNTYGLSLTFLDSLNIELPLVSTVFVANLDYAVDESMLKEVFAISGNVMDVEIFKDREGKSRGFGVVDFEHPVEAVQAISMLHNQMYRDRPLSVRMDRSERKKDVPKPKLPAGLKSVGMGLGLQGGALKDLNSLSANNSMPSVTPMGGMTQMPNPSMPLGGSLMGDPMGRMGSGISRMDLGSNSLTGYSSNSDFSSQSYGGSAGGSLGNIVYVSNLPLDYTSENLRELCWTYGDVRLAEMRSQGTGMVKFRQEADANRAVERLDRQPLEGRLLSARLL